jgi:GAF domain-containing protein
VSEHAGPPGSPEVRTEELAALLEQMGAVLLSTETISTTLELVTQLATQTIPATAGAGLTLVDHQGKRSVAASNPLVQQADLLQYELDEGPCLTAWRDQVPVRIDDVAAETRWPRWSAVAADLGLRSLLSVPLVAGGTAIGAIKVYSHQRHAYDARAERVLSLFAHQAAILLTNTQTLSEARAATGNLAAALVNRDIIGQAKGVLIAQGAPDEQAAFTMLAAASQRSNLKLPDVARQLVQSVAARNAQPAELRPVDPRPGHDHPGSERGS